MKHLFTRFFTWLRGLFSPSVITLYCSPIFKTDFGGLRFRVQAAWLTGS